jgi:hypothetical protein
LLKIDESASQVQRQDLKNVHITEEVHPLMMVGRAKGKINSDLSVADWHSFTYCPFKDLRILIRYSLTISGMLQICQRISLGNIWVNPLFNLMEQFDRALIQSMAFSSQWSKGLADEI